MAARTPSPPPFPVPQNTPFTSRPGTSASRTTHSSRPSTSTSESASTNYSGLSTSTLSPSTTASSHSLQSLISLLLPSPTPSSSTPTTASPSSPPSTTSPLPSLTHVPPSPFHPHLTSHISALSLHPTLEATLHIANADLPSAHFLVRHMSGPPAVEGMLLHSILHRIEGDFENARLWGGDVADACKGWAPKRRGEEGGRLERSIWQGCGLGGRGEDGDGGREGAEGAKGDERTLLSFVYADSGSDHAPTPTPGEESAKRLITSIEAFRARKSSSADAEAQDLSQRTRRELSRVLEWCILKFGDGAWVDASSAWVSPGEDIRKIGNDMVSGDKGWRKF